MKRYEIVSIEKLKPLEQVFPSHLKNLTVMILADGIMKCPILADVDTGIVLDGSHRYIFLLEQGYLEAPVKFVNYKDENIRVGTHLIHRFLCDGEECGISKREVTERGISGNLYPPRTTRHFFPFRKLYPIDLSLGELKKGEKVDVSKYIADVSLEYEINHNLKYLEEIEAEIDEIIIYLDEVRHTREYLKKQICEMRKLK